MNQSQRIVLVVALGIALVIVGVSLNVLLNDPLDSVGWERLMPGGDVTSSDNYFVVTTDESVVRQALVWLAGVAIWTAASWRILRSPEA